jgi:hypothetical protein
MTNNYRSALAKFAAILLRLALAGASFALFSGLLLLAFAFGMTLGTGIKSALNASVFSASAGAFLLATRRDYPWSLDALGSESR